MQPFQRHEQNCDNVYSYHITLNRKQTTTLNLNSIMIHCLGDQKQFIGLWHLLTETSAGLQFNSLQNVPNSVLFWVHCWLKKKKESRWKQNSRINPVVCVKERDEWRASGRQKCKNIITSPLRGYGIKAGWKSTSGTHQCVCCDQTVFSLRFFHSSRSPLIDYRNCVF